MQIEPFISSIYKTIEYFQGVNIQESIFEVFSDHYYKENFHSDILAYYLNHREVMPIFLKWIGDDKINLNDYKDYSIIREKNKIDLLIYNNNKNSAIIIENKSNGAGDQFKQIPRYVEKLGKEKVSIDKILYINKNSLNLPNTSDWSQSDKDEIISKIKTVQLLGKDSISEDLIKKVILKTGNIRLNSLSQEMLIMFTNSVQEVKNLSMLDELYNFLKNENSHEKLIHIIDAYNNIPTFLASHYKKYYEINKDKLVEKIWLYRPHILVFEMRHNDRKFGIDIVFTRLGINISIIGRNDVNCEDIKNDIGDNFILSRVNDNERYNLQIDRKKMFDDKAVIESINNVVKSFG